MEPMPVMNANHPPSMWLRQWMGLCYTGLTIISAPGEMATRINYGSQYIHPVILCLCVLLTEIIAFCGLIGDPAIRIMSGRAPATIGMYSLCMLFFFLLPYHLYRVARLMRHMDLEEYSMSDGDPLPIFHWLPGATWIRIRVIYEPLAVIIVSSLLFWVHILEPLAYIYLLVVGFSMCAKQAIRLYSDWLRRREARDAIYLLGVAKRVSSGTITARDAAVVPAGRLPSHPVEREHIARSLSPEYAALITPTTDSVN